MKRLIFDINMLSVEFNNGILDNLHKKAQEFPNDPERGGIILGRLFPEVSKIIVTDVIESKRAKSHRMGFTMNVGEVQDIIDKAWEDSGGKITYIGDWHTHPEPNAAPSLTDQVTFRLNYFGSKIDQNFLLYIIVGSNDILGQGLWMGISNGYTLQRLQQVNENHWNSK